MFKIVWEIAVQAYLALRSDMPRLLRICALPAALIVVCDLLALSFPSLKTALLLASLVGYVLLAVQVHQYVLHADTTTGLAPAFMLNAKFALWFVGLCLLLLASLLPLLAMPKAAWFAWPLALLPGAYFTSRLSLVLPDRAIGGFSPISTIWNWSDGNGWRLVMVLYIPPIAINGLLSLLLVSAADEVEGLISVFVSIPVAVFEVAILSCSYMSLKKRSKNR